MFGNLFKPLLVDLVPTVGGTSGRSIVKYLHPIMWNEAQESKYHMLPITVLVMHAIRVKSSLKCEAKASPIAATIGYFLIAFLCGHFVA